MSDLSPQAELRKLSRRLLHLAEVWDDLSPNDRAGRLWGMAGYLETMARWEMRKLAEVRR
jgi:hypothetical protein